MQPAIAIRSLVKRYGGRAVVDHLTFDVAPGEVFALLGPNGAGKTTTVEILEGYRAPDAGEVRVLGLDPQRDGAALKPRIGLMLQQGGIYPQIRPAEALRLFARFYPNPRDPEELLREAGLAQVAGTRYRRLSGGEKQRLSLALALVGRPQLVFLDEPTAAMDPQARRATWDVVRDLKRQGTTVVLTTHFLDEAERLADRVAIIDHGRLVALGSPAELMRPADSDVLWFTASAGLDTAALGAHLDLPVRDEGMGHYVVEARVTPALLAALTAWLAQRDVLLTDLHSGRRSLEEVYLHLTRSEAAV